MWGPHVGREMCVGRSKIEWILREGTAWIYIHIEHTAGDIIQTLLSPSDPCGSLDAYSTFLHPALALVLFATPREPMRITDHHPPRGDCHDVPKRADSVSLDRYWKMVCTLHAGCWLWPPTHLERVWIIGQLSWLKSQNWCALLTGYNVGHWYMEAIRLGGWSIRISGLYSQFNLVKMTFSSLIHTAVVEPEVYLSASALRLFQNARRWWAAFPLIYSDCRDLTDEAKIPCIVVFPPM